jgi:CRP/FNR family cyclic AMP-dependent transcriptional regulator
MPIAPPVDGSALDDVPLFRGLRPDELTHVRGLVHRRRFPAEARIINADEAGESVYVVMSGAVKVQIERASGDEVILAILGAGEVLGEMSLVDHLGRSAAVIALEDSTLATMARAHFWQCLRTIPIMTYNLVEILSRRLRMANGEIESLAALDVEGRLARRLLDFAREYGQRAPGGGVTIPFRLTQHDLARLVGASRVRVNQVLGDYRRRNLVAIDSRFHITVLDAASLAKECL